LTFVLELQYALHRKPGARQQSSYCNGGGHWQSTEPRHSFARQRPVRELIQANKEETEAQIA
jgi:hypothetical protein